MTSPGNAGPLKPPPSLASRASLELSKTRIPHGGQSHLTVAENLPYRRSNPSLSSLFASTSTLPASRSISPNAGASPARAAILSPGARTDRSPSPFLDPQPNDPRNLVIRSLVPHVAIQASLDTDQIAKQKGFQGGLQEILRPFGEVVQGRVTVRDSIGASRSWGDFGIRFVGLGDGLEDWRPAGRRSTDSRPHSVNVVSESHPIEQGSPSKGLRTGGNIAHIEEVVGRHLSYAEMLSNNHVADYLNQKEFDNSPSFLTSPFFTLYFRRLLSGLPLTPHETFSHPVACIIAISSRNPSPIEALRQLYSSTNQGSQRLPVWVNNDYLRYYVLIHDEDRDDIVKSTALFEQMKRHFGLHCHLLRLRSSQCVPTDDDSVRMPSSEWISGAEELDEIQTHEGDDGIDDPTPCLFESDTTAIRTFVREMVTQSIIPSMERSATTWNDQVASRRRGIGGRFISLSKRWTGFGSGSSSRGASVSGSPGASSNSNTNYDPVQGFYRPDAPEAIMRKLADFAFMLRDWKLAQSTYELLRTDFNNDKAWKYHAGANEMAAISTLLVPQLMTSKMRSETIDQMLETASYSYITRCAAPYSALRCLALGVELLRVRGGSAADDAARWAMRLLELKIVGPIGHALFTERVATCFWARKGAGSAGWGSRRRKAALWDVLATEAWLGLQRTVQADKCLDNATTLYSKLCHEQPTLPFDGMEAFVEDLRRILEAHAATQRDESGEYSADDEATFVEEESEKLDHRENRKSLLGVGVAPFNSLDSGPLSPVRTTYGDSAARDGSFS
ncbi:MAG: hypothetical protein M1827_002287 [Pycnora praestabilis]|nr:MAG: hypothetical protein M1827_002287 [Pycnora praestabilis]